MRFFTTRDLRSFALLVLAGILTACDQGHGAASSADETLQDGEATAREARASLAGGVAPGAQTYSFRGLYAGMTRAHLETAIGVVAPDSTCHAAMSRGHDDLVCAYELTIGPEHDRLAIEATYTRPASLTESVARIVSVTRQLPLDVDGVRLAQLLADAFERQTTLLDKRDAEYGRHTAMVRMGTLRGARENYADVSIQFSHGREILTVKLSRSDAAPASLASPSPAPSR